MRIFLLFYSIERLLEFLDFDVAEVDLHDVSGMELETERAFFLGGVGFIGDAFDAVEPGFVNLAFGFDFEGVPVVFSDGSDGFFSFDRITFSVDVGGGGEVTFEGTGDADLDLVIFSAQENAGVDGAFTVFEVDGEDEIGEFFFSPKEDAFFFRAILAVDHAVFSCPVSEIAFGVAFPTAEVFAVEEADGLCGIESGEAGGEEKS